MTGHREISLRGMPMLIAIFFLFSIVCATPSALRAAPAKESSLPDQVWVQVTRSNLRSGPGAQYSAVGVVVQGTQLKVVGAASDWFEVQPRSGKRGWIIQRAVTAIPPRDVIVRTLERKIEKLAEENEGLSEEIQRLSDTRQDLELQTSELKADVVLLTAKNEDLQHWRILMWVILGLLVHLTGWGLGFIAGSFRRQAEDKRYNSMMKDAAKR